MVEIGVCVFLDGGGDFLYVGIVSWLLEDLVC